MSRRPSTAVEPLSRPAWERVEARLFERLDRGEHLSPPASAPPALLERARWAPVALVGTVLAAAAAVALWLSSPSSVEPSLARAPSSEAANEEAHITTTDAPTHTALGGATLTLAARSELRVAGSDAGGWLVRLARGQVDCEVAPRQGRPPFVVLAGATRVTVVGTRFTVTRDGDGARVHVRGGRVRVASGDEERTLGPGESWPPAAPPDVTPPAVSPPTTAAEPPPPPVISADELEPEREPAAAVSPKPAARRAKLRRPAASSARPPRASAQPAELFARAAQLEVKEPRRAIALYRQLAARSGAWAANALYAEARLELERGRRERAVALLQRYLQRHPDGSNAADVSSLLRRLGHTPQTTTGGPR